ncbi:MAG: signal peptidase II [Holosporaceae bacterium]|jgi:signal peptidase II|nr:signal peptidase II [Holosporaceae bacterium]
MQKMPRCFSSGRISALVAIFILLSDQISKFAVVDHLRPGEQWPVYFFLNIVHVENRGVTFGILKDALPPWLWVLVSMTIVLFLFLWARDKKQYRLPAALVAAGAVGNSIDRMAHGAVIDFLDFYASTYHWPAFNIADSAVVVGAVVLFFLSCGGE